jgi:hypothetical protein
MQRSFHPKPSQQRSVYALCRETAEFSLTLGHSRPSIPCPSGPQSYSPKTASVSITLEMKQTHRKGILIAALIVLSSAWGLSTWVRGQAKARREALHLATLEQDLQELQRVEQARVASGDVWVEELHARLPAETGAQAPSSPNVNSLLHQRRLARLMHFPGSELTVNTELHECNPGSEVCTTGGSIQVRMGTHFVCAVSVGLLQVSASGQPSSYYRVDWQPKADGSTLTRAEKLAIVHQLALGGRLRSTSELQSLLESAYSLPTGSAAGDENPHLRSLVSTIFRAIVDSQET